MHTLVETYLNRSLVIGLAATVALSFTACGGGGGGDSQGNVIPKADFSACDQNPTVGSSAIIGNASKTDFVASNFFGKPYDRFDLEAVLDASVVATTEYVKSLGINLMKVTVGSPAGKCPNYFSLPNANEPLEKVWNEASSGTNGNASLQGLFLEFCGAGTGVGCRERQMVNPTILVNHVSDRWTLVHEMMHYNFNQGRKAAQDIPTNAMLDKMTKYHSAQFKKFLNDFEALPNRGDLANAVKELEQLVKISHHLMFRKALEEIAIEGMLIDLWAKDEFKNSGARTPSTWYMEFSRGQAMQQAGEFDDFISPLQSAAEQNFWPEIVADVKAVKELIDMPKNESLRMIKEAKTKIAIKTGRGSQEMPETSPGEMEPGTGETAPVEIPSVSARAPHSSVEMDFSVEHAHNHLDQLDREQREKKFIEVLRELKRELQN